MRGKTAKLIRKEAKTRKEYRILKHAFRQLSWREREKVTKEMRNG